MPSVGACFPICLGAPQGACGDRGASDGEGDLARPPCPAAGQEGLILTQTKMEKKEKVMAALALLLPRRNCLGDECCHWLVRKQKPTNQTPAQRTAGAGEKRGELAQEGPPRASTEGQAGSAVASLHCWSGASCHTRLLTFQSVKIELKTKQKQNGAPGHTSQTLSAQWLHVACGAHTGECGHPTSLPSQKVLLDSAGLDGL